MSSSVAVENEINIELSASQYEVTQSTDRYLMLVSGEGEGKSLGAIAGLLAHAGRIYDYLPDDGSGGKMPMRACIVRSTHAEISRNLIPNIKRAFGDRVFTFHRQEAIMLGPNIHADLVGLDRPDSLTRIQGSSYDMVIVDDAVPMMQAGRGGISWEAWIMIVRKMRSGDTPKQCITSFNPGDGNHWTTRLCEEPLKDMKIIRFKRGENRHISDVDREARAAVLEGNAALMARYEYGITASMWPGRPAVPNFKADVHVSKVAMKAPKDGAFFLFCDGGLHPAIIIAVMQSWGQLWLLDSFVGDGIGMRQLLDARVLPRLSHPDYAVAFKRKHLWRAIGDPSMRPGDASDSNASPSRAITEMTGISFEGGAMDPIVRQNGLLDAFAKWIDNKPFMLVNSEKTPGESEHWILRALEGGYYYQTGPSGDIIGNVPYKGNQSSHIGDALAHSLPRIIGRPARILRSVKPQEAVGSYAVR